jgi:predicted nucleic acid-binding protein
VSYLLDTGFLYALLNANEQLHGTVRQAAERLGVTPLLPTPVTVEVAYLIRRDLGVEALAQFMADLAEPRYALVAPTAADYRRAATIVRRYADAQLDFVDAVLAAMAERLDIRRILTLDQRHFRLFRPRHCDAFELIP